MSIIIGLIIAFIIIIVENQNLKNENVKLKKRIEELSKISSKDKILESKKEDSKIILNDFEKVETILDRNELNNDDKEFLKTQSQIDTLQKDDEKISSSSSNIYRQSSNVYKDASFSKDQKNSLILIMGSVFIVLSAIIFLTSTWSSIASIIKTLTIFLMFFVFLAASKLSDKLNIKNTSNAFYYIAMAYLPIAFFSISVFSLLGNYFSLHGDGKFWYLSLMSFLMAIIYTYVSKKKNNKLIYIFNECFRVLFISFFALMFTTKFNIILLANMIYFIMFLVKPQVLIFDNNKKFDDNINKIYFIVALLGSFVLFFDNLLFSFLDIFVLLIYNYLINIRNNKEKLTYYVIMSVIVSLLSYKTGNYLYTFCSYNLVYIFISIITVIILLISAIKRFDKINMESGLITSIYSFIVLAFIVSTYVIPVYLWLLFYTLYLFLILYYSKNKNIVIYFVIGFIYITYFAFLNNYNLDIRLFIPLSITLFSLPLIIKKQNYILDSIEYTSLIVNLMALIGMSYNYFKDYIYSLYLVIFIVICFAYYFLKNKKYKVISYIGINYLSLILFNLFASDVTYLAIPLSAILVLVVERFMEDNKSPENIFYSMFNYIIALFILLVENNIPAFIVLIVLNVVAYLYSKEKNINIATNVIISLSFAKIIYLSKLFDQNSNYLLSIILISILTLLSVKQEKENEFTFLSYLMIFMHLSTVEVSKYLTLLLFIINCVLCIYKFNNKKIYEAFIYILSLIFVFFIIHDLDLKLTIYKLMPCIIFTEVFSRRIIKPYNKDYKILEYISYSFLNIIALVLYNGQVDGMIFGIGLFVLVVFGYIYKYGPLFLSSAISLLANAFLLTREFWFSIPWWIYLLVIGISLILFAMNNELRDKNKNKLKDSLNNLKKDLDL